MKAFCEMHADEVDFYLWLQWLAYSQFAACWQVSRAITCRSGCIAIWPSAWRKAGGNRVRPRALLSESLRRCAAGYSGPAWSELGLTANGSARDGDACPRAVYRPAAR